MSRRALRITAAALTILLLLLGCAGGGVLLLHLTTGINDAGSPKLASEWRAALEPLESLEEAKEANPPLQGKRFPNGEWVFWRSQDSHGLWQRGGGTVVVKDSRGAVRAFFGHVCGPVYLENQYWVKETSNLDAFYQALKEGGFVEHEFD